MARKLNKRTKAGKLATVNAVANGTGRDRRTIERRIALAGIVPVMMEGWTRMFRRSDLEPLLKDEASVPGTAENLSACERLRRLQLQNDKLEFELADLRKRYVSVADVAGWMREVIARAETVLRPGPAHLAPRLIGESIPEASRILDDWVHDALTQLSENPMSEPEA